MLELVLYDFSPGVIDGGDPALVDSLQVGVSQDDVVLGFEGDAVEAHGLDAVEHEYLQLFYLLQEFFLYLLLVFG